jgi:hypothetical protein
MAISFSCPCGKKLNVKDELAGKRGKCPACGELLTIPQPAKPAQEWSLAPLEDELKPVTPPTKSAKPPVVFQKPSAGTAAATPKNAASSSPAPLDLAPLASELNHSSWIDEGAEAEFKIAGAPLPPTTGQIFATTTTHAPVSAKPGGRPGDLLCPYCNKDLERTLTAGSISTQIVLGLVAGFYFAPTTPFRCHRCGPIKFEELIGESKKTAKQQSSAFERGCLKIVLIIVGIVSLLVLMLFLATEYYRSSPMPPPAELPGEVEQRQKEFDQRVEQQQRLLERRRLENEERMRESRERFNKMTQQNHGPTAPPNPKPLPNNPPMPAPKPMPVNPFQPVD